MASVGGPTSRGEERSRIGKGCWRRSGVEWMAGRQDRERTASRLHTRTRNACMGAKEFEIHTHNDDTSSVQRAERAATYKDRNPGVQDLRENLEQEVRARGICRALWLAWAGRWKSWLVGRGVPRGSSSTSPPSEVGS